MVAHRPAKIIHAPNFARSAMAPEMSATVMIAKVAWKPTNASGGYAAPSGVSSRLDRPMADQSMDHGGTRPSAPGNAIAYP
jgi:hypothetical protein